MCYLRFTMSASYCKAVECRMKTAQRLGHLRQVKYCLAILAVVDGQSYCTGCLALAVCTRRPSQPGYVSFVVMGSRARHAKSRPVARPKLTPAQKASLMMLIDEGPVTGWVQWGLLAFAHDPAAHIRALRRLLQCLLYCPVAAGLQALAIKKRPLSRIISMRASGTSGGPPRGRRFCAWLRRARPCCSLAMKRHSRSGGRSRTPGRDGASNPWSRPQASAKAIKSSG